MTAAPDVKAPFGWVVRQGYGLDDLFVRSSEDRDRHIKRGNYVTPVWAAMPRADLSSLTRTGEAEPVAWQWRVKGDRVWVSATEAPVFKSGAEDLFETRPLFAHPATPAIDDAAVERDEWQPIETAPKDGTWLDIWAGDRRIPDVRWVDEADPDELGFTWGWVGATGHYVLGEDEEATHWMRVEPPRRSRET